MLNTLQQDEDHFFEIRWYKRVYSQRDYWKKMNVSFIFVWVNSTLVFLPFQNYSFSEKMNVSLIVHFCVGKYSFSLDPFFSTARISKEINVLFIVHFCLGKYSFSLDTFLNNSYFKGN